MANLFGVTTHGYDRPIGELVCPRILSEYHDRNDTPNKYTACDLGRTSAVFPNRNLQQLDLVYGSNDGYSYGSFERASLLRRRHFPSAETPRETYRLPILTSMRYHWFHGDPALAPGYDEDATRNPLGQCEVAKKTYPPATVAGLTTREVNAVLHQQERGLVKKATAGEGAAGSAGSDDATAAGHEGERSRAPEKHVWRQAAGPEHEKVTDQDGCALVGACPPSEGKQAEAREVCQQRPTAHLWHKHRRRHPQFHSAMTRFVETVRINDKLFELF